MSVTPRSHLPQISYKHPIHLVPLGKQHLASSDFTYHHLGIPAFPRRLGLKCISPLKQASDALLDLPFMHKIGHALRHSS